MDDYFTICLYKTGEPKNIEISNQFEYFGVKQACFFEIQNGFLQKL